MPVFSGISGTWKKLIYYSHSIVAGGLGLMS